MLMGARVMVVALLATLIGAGRTPAQAPERPPEVTAAEARAAASPRDLDALMDLGEACYNADLLEEAAGAFRQAVAVAPESVPALVNLGVTLNDLGQAQEAATHLERALALRPEDAAVRTNLAIARYTLGETERAVELLTQVIEQEPANQLAHFQLGVMFAEARLFEEAVAEWQAVVAAGPETVEGRQARENLERLEAILASERHRQRQDAIRSR